MKRFTIFLLAMIMLLSIGFIDSFVVRAADDVPPDAIHIKNETQLRAIPANAAGYYVLDNDIILYSQWVPIDGFKGTFDGQGYAVKNLYVLSGSSRQYAGLFGTSADAIIKNVGVMIGSQGLAASGSMQRYAGGLVGLCSNTKITDCYVTGDIKAADSAGGLIGTVAGLSDNVSVERCYYANGSVSNASYAGGLFGGCKAYEGNGNIVFKRIFQSQKCL